MDTADLLPPPPEYIQLTQERALWQNLGLRPDDLTITEYLDVLAMLKVEAKYQRKPKAE